jgi:hypothetical protein
MGLPTWILNGHKTRYTRKSKRMEQIQIGLIWFEFVLFVLFLCFIRQNTPHKWSPFRRV